MQRSILGWCLVASLLFLSCIPVTVSAATVQARSGNATGFADGPEYFCYARTAYYSHNGLPVPSQFSITSGGTIWPGVNKGGMIALQASGSWVQMATTTATTCVGVEFWCDQNDGYARVLVDGLQVWLGNIGGDPATSPVYIEVSNLAETTHTLKVEWVGTAGPSGGTDVGTWFFGIGKKQPPPLITSLTAPGDPVQVDGISTYTVDGSNFMPGITSSVSGPWAGVIETRYVSPTELQVDIAYTEEASGTTQTLTVTNPGGLSGSFSFSAPGLEPLPFQVDAATASFNPKQTDHFTIRGRVHGLSLTDAETVYFEAGLLSDEIPVGNFERDGEKYSYTAQWEEKGIFVLEIDLAEGTFQATGTKLSLAGFTNPLPVKLQAGSFKGCSMVHFRVSGNKWTFQKETDSQYPCVFEGAPQAEPNGFFVNTRTKIRIQVTVNSNPALIKGSIKLYRVNAKFKVTGKPICALYDDGKETHGDQQAGDGIFSCLANLSETAAGELRLAVRAQVGSRVILSPSTTVDVISRMTQKEIDRTLSANAKAASIWKNMRARHGNTPKACEKALPGIRKVIGIKSAGLSNDGSTIQLSFDSGMKGVLVLPLNPPPAVTGNPVSRKDAAQDPSSIFHKAEKQGRLGSGQRAILRGPSLNTPAQSAVGNCRVFLYAPFKWDFGNDEIDLFGRAKDYFTVLAAKNRMTFNPVDNCVDRESGDNNCTESLLDKLTDYGTIIFDTHGAVLDDGNVTLSTHTIVTRENLNTNRIQRMLGAQRTDLSLFAYEWWRQEGEEIVKYIDTYYGIGPRFISRLPGRFNNAIIYAGACYSLDNDTLAKAFINKGAAVYFGFDNATSTSHSRVMFGSGNHDHDRDPGVFDGMIKHRKTAREAYWDIPKESQDGGTYARHYEAWLDGKYYNTMFKAKTRATKGDVVYNCTNDSNDLQKYKYVDVLWNTYGLIETVQPPNPPSSAWQDKGGGWDNYGWDGKASAFQGDTFEVEWDVTAGERSWHRKIKVEVGRDENTGEVDRVLSVTGKLIYTANYASYEDREEISINGGNIKLTGKDPGALYFSIGGPAVCDVIPPKTGWSWSKVRDRYAKGKTTETLMDYNCRENSFIHVIIWSEDPSK